MQRINREQAKTPSATVENHQARWLEFQRIWYRKFEDILHQAHTGPMWLQDERVSRLVAEKLWQDDGPNYRLDAYCIMSNHVHVVFTPNLNEVTLQEEVTPQGIRFVSAEATLPQIMQALKGVTAREANLVLERRGAFWERESYDHYVRDEAEFYRVIKYTLNNPVKAQLVDHWRDWAGNYLAPRFDDWAATWS